MDNSLENEQRPSSEDSDDSDGLKAGTVYVILKKSCYVPRSLRIQWYLQHLNTRIRITQHEDNSDDEVVVVSIVPEEPTTKDWNPENSHLYEYLVTLSTNVVFLGEVNCVVYCLDISPSVSTVDSQYGEVLLDVIIESLKKSITLLVNLFDIPGSSHSFKPDIFITVIAHTPFFISPAQQVLVQGWKISKDNLNEFLGAVLRQLEFIEDAVARVSGSIHEQFEAERKNSTELENLNGLFSEDLIKQSSPFMPTIAMVSPASGFLNLLRFGMLALKLLPVSNFSNLVVITDGMIVMPDSDTLDSVLNHMRYNDIACNFIHVGSQFHPHCGFGFVPYAEVMQLISVATNGSYLQFYPQYKQQNGLNIYQQNFLTWSLKRKSVVLELSTPHPKEGDWTITNAHFYGNRGPQLMTKKYLENDINVTLYGVLACRIREGFILNEMYIKDDELMINFILPWTNHIYIEYTASCKWPVIPSSSVTTHFMLNIKAPYEFLHDISCHMKTPIKSPFRQALIARFWRSLKSFAQSDLLLSHLESFMNMTSSYYLPEGLKSGMPLFYLASGSNQPLLTSNDMGFTQYGAVWRPACLLNNNLWLKWFHADRVGIIFHHDELLNLFCERSKKSIGIQCRLASNTLFTFLKNYSSFVLIDNHSYIKFLLPTESGTGKHSFYVIRSICKAPYAVIHIAFLYNIPGSVRSKVIKDFKRSLGVLRVSRPLQKESTHDILNPERILRFGSTYDLFSNCCIILEKPLEKILIRYEQMPSEFSTVVFPDGTQPSSKAQSPLASNRGLITTLSRYLHHRRWIWKASINQKIFLPVNALENILSTLVKIRLQEGFYFAHFSAGICNMALEVQMKGSTNSENEPSNGIDYNYHDDDDSEELHSCIIQYVLFPPRILDTPKRENESENSNPINVIELVSECWIEPQNGVITNCPPTRSYMSNLQYHQLPDAIWSIDAKCISALCTFEHLRLMCESPGVEAPDSIQNLLSKCDSSEYWPNVAPFEDQRISHIPFPYTVPNLLCQSVQENLLYNVFSLDVLDKSENGSEPNKLLLDSMFNHLSIVHSKELLICGQDAQYLIKNFRRSSRSSEKRNLSASIIDLEERFSPDLPSSRDWERMIAWALGRSNSNDFDKHFTFPRNSVQYQVRPDISENELRFRRSFMSDFNESHHSSNFDLSSISYLENVDWLKWKCYVKFVSKQQCIVTVVPASLDVIKRIAIDQENKIEHSNIVSDTAFADFDIEAHNVENVTEVTNPANQIRNDSNSVYTSCSLSSKDLIGEDSVYDETADMSTELAKDCDINTSFRLRASTWDPVRRVMDSHMNADDRLRTNSVGARVRPLTRLRPKRSFDFESKEKVYAENAMKVTKFVPLVLPVYVYNCTMPDVINYLIFKDNYGRFETQNESFEANGNLDDTIVQMRKSYQDSALGEYNLDEQCNSIDAIFTKFFVFSLFKCLHHGCEIPLNDVEQGFSKCETSILTIDITDYLKVVCRHLRNLVSTTHTQEDGESSKCIIPVASLISSTVCNELRFIHRLIKKKFANILTSDFKPIPSKPEFYYFFPSWTKESKPSSAGILSPGFTENNSTAVSVDQIIPVNSSNLAINTWDTCKESVNSEDNACTSLISNMDSDSLNEISNESLMDDVNPLFLRVDCKISSNGRVAKCSLHLIPTCICEILKCLDKSFSDVDVNDLKVTLDLLCLTSPFIDVKKKMPKTAETTKVPGFVDEVNKVNAYEDAETLSFDEGRVPRQIMSLPDYQYNALNTCIAQMKWLIKDEIITFMLDTSPITSETLKMVCNHIESSPNAATCFIEKVPLSFVFGNEETSLNNFLAAFDSMKIPYYRLKKDNNMYYLVKDSLERTFYIKDFEERGDIESTSSKLMTTSMEILNEEQENFFQVFSSSESISENESIKIINTVQRQESITDAEEDNNRMLQSTVQWILNRDSSNVEMPNFWLIMTITTNYVIVYFHCRFLEINKKEIKDYVLVRENVISNIKNLCKSVNQKMLLTSLHDTRVCDQLLEPDAQNDDSENEAPNPDTETNYAFVAGYFACNVVWETKFILHPRLKMSPVKSGVSRGIQALCSALSGFFVTNRKNLFVYQDVNKNVFYLRLYETVHGVLKSHDGEDTSSGSFSRSSSFTSLNRKLFDEQLPFMLDETKSRNKSTSDNNESNCKGEDYIALRVYGITETGNDIKNDLVQALQNKLDDAVLEVISVMLSRNPVCKLLSEDVRFIQKPYQHPNTIIQFNVDIWVVKYLHTFRYLIKQNMQQFASAPKYADPRSSYHFQDYSVPEDSPKRVSESDIFLYNQSPTNGKGIACLALAMVDGNNEAIECNDEYDPNIRHILAFFSLEELKERTAVKQSSNETENCVKVEFRIWKQGRINIETLEPKLMSAIRHALWELVMEKISLVYPLFDSDSNYLYKAYHSVIPSWMNFGTELSIASVRVWDISLPIKCNLHVILRELNQIFPTHDTACYAFYKYDIPGETEYIFTPCTNFTEVMGHGGDTCLLIGRSMKHVQNALEHCTVKVNLEPKSDKGLQRLPSTTQDDSFVPVIKQKFILIKIANSKITMYIYNWPKDKIDAIIKLVTNLCEWITARSYLLTSIVEQKMGIFFNHPLQRLNIPKKVTEMAKLDINVLFKFPMIYQKSNSGIPLYSVSESFRDVKLPKEVKNKITDKNPFSQNVSQLMEVHSIDKKTHQKHLFSSWQAKGGSTSNIPVNEEMLNNFLLHGRLIHYCLTPLLFMPKWRVDAAATRDHSLFLKNQSQEKIDDSHSYEDEEWHIQICTNFIHEYKQYLQCLGFFPIQTSESFSKNLSKPNTDEPIDKRAHYMQKFSHGGVLLFELFFEEPFFNAKLYALDYAMLKTKPSSLLSQFAVSFLDECDRIKFQMHLHSYTYDYHLRCLHQYITDQQPLLQQGYHIIEFLDDFIKYYPKASNYARSLVHAEYISVENVAISPIQLFDYLLTNGKKYDLRASCMISQNGSSDLTENVQNKQYVLIQNKHKSGVSYKDANDLQQTDDFDITIIMSHININDAEKIMKFQVYILLTSRRELYPKVEVEQKLGKFRTVSTSHDYSSSNDEEVNLKFTIDGDGSSSSKESQDSKDTRKKRPLPFHVEIKQELVNYLGYYSSHEEVMQNLMKEEVEEVKKYIENVVVQGAFDCETHLLWNKLLCSKPTALTYTELQHLLSLAEVLDISSMDSQLRSILNRPMSWFQSFIKILASKLPDCHLFTSPNGNMQELLILHSQYSNGFVMIVLNFQTNNAAMNLVYRRDIKCEDEARLELQTLFEQIINTCCYHLWMDAF